MSTIFVTSFHVLISRNILSTEVFRCLAGNPDLRVVLFVPAAKRGYFEKSFGWPNVVVEGVPTALGRVDILLRNFALVTLASKTLAIKRRAERAATGGSIRFWLREAVARCVAGRRWSLALLRFLDRAFAPRRRADPYFERYQPALVFATDVQNESDLMLLRAARRRSIPTVGMVRSWDNLTAKGLLRIVPDVLVVNNEVVAREATTFNRVSEERIRVVGVPHYDAYRAHVPAAREVFFREVGLDPRGRLVLVAPVGDRYVCEFRKGCTNDVDCYLLETLVRAQSRGELPRDLQFLVRLPPTDVVYLDGFRPPTGMVIEQPGVGSASGALKEQELSADDDRHLADSITHAALVITGPSTIAVDAACLDRPVIVTKLEPSPRPYFSSIARFYDYDHFRPIVTSGGAKVAKTPEELTAAIQRFLADPTEGAPGRERIRREECFRLDGHSSERLLAVLAPYLQP